MIKRNIKYVAFLLFIGVSLLFGSCEKWLSVSPKTELKVEDLLSTESGFDDVLTGVYSIMTTSSSYGANLSYAFLDVLAQYHDSPRTGFSTGDHLFKYAADYDFTASSEEGRIKSIWTSSYRAISNLNMGLKYIDKNRSVFADDTTYHVYKGEYLALRAMLHFDILRIFGQAPASNQGQGMSTLSIPYFDTYTNIAQPQCTVREALDKIIADLKAAKQTMVAYDPYGPISSEKNVATNVRIGTRVYRMNYYATTALLARVYLYAGEKQNALAEAKEIVNEPTVAPMRLFTMATKAPTTDFPQFINEDLFSINVVGLEKAIENYFIESNKNSILKITSAQRDAYFDKKGTGNDFRTNWFKSTSDGKFMLNKFNKMTRQPLLTVSEVYLIAAECTDGVQGMEYLNKIRAHRGLNALGATDAFQTELYREYKREMIGNGQLFFFYKRNLYTSVGMADDVKINNVLTNYVLPIPKLEIEFGKIK